MGEKEERLILAEKHMREARRLLGPRTRICPVCLAVFTPSRKDQVYCNTDGSQACRSKGYRMRQAEAE